MAISQQKYQRVVFSDPVAFHYLEEDPCTQVLAKRQVLKGYECFLVEQWACSRTDPTFAITTFTGDEKSQAIVNVLSVPTDKSAWSPRLRAYFQSLTEYHARQKQTTLGIVMVTNLSSFPSSLTVIPIPNGDVRRYRDSFLVNENLKRLGCCGRVGLTLSPPNAATAAKFYQLYRTSEKIDLGSAVIELVKLCQIALVLFEELEPVYADGLLCDCTERAINNWWLEFGTDHYRIEPHDGILGPTTVAALLGTLMGARNRLHAYGTPISKDVFDIENTKHAISSFQKAQRMPRTRRLDRQTIERIHRSTAKAASKEGWFVPRAVKSTVAELGGKGGEMVMDIVGGGSKPGIAEVETADIDQFVHFIQGERAKWLWQGKARKAPSEANDDVRHSRRGAVTSYHLDDEPDNIWPSDQQYKATETAERDHVKLSKKHVDRTNKDRSSDTSRGLARHIKDAVGRKHTASKLSKTDIDTLNRPTFNVGPVPGGTTGIDESVLPVKSFTSTFSMQNSSPKSTQGRFVHDPVESTLLESAASLEYSAPPSDDEKTARIENDDSKLPLSPVRSVSPSIAGSLYAGLDGQESLTQAKIKAWSPRAYLLRSSSDTEILPAIVKRNHARWPKHLSFSLVADSILTWEPLDNFPLNEDMNEVDVMCSGEKTRRLRGELHELETDLADWVTEELQKVHDIKMALDQDHQEVHAIQSYRSEEYQNLKSGSTEIMDQEKKNLKEAVGDVETLEAKLEYEINVLRGKVEDVEDGVVEFERQVAVAEAKVVQLEISMQPKPSWMHWLLRIFIQARQDKPTATQLSSDVL